MKIFEWFKDLPRWAQFFWASVSMTTFVILWMLLAWMQAQWFDSGNWLTTKAIPPSAVYRIDSAGDDFRSYEWKTKSEGPELLCIFAAATQKAGLHCHPTGKIIGPKK